MPKRTRRPVQMILGHTRMSGLFLVGGEYVADIKTNDGRRIRRNFGTDRVRGLRLFDALVEELEAEEGDNPRLADFLSGRFLPTQRHLKSFRYSEQCVTWLLRWLDETEPRLRVRDVTREHGERLKAHYAALAPQTVKNMFQKFKQALYYAADLEMLAANPLARVSLPKVTNRRTRHLAIGDFVRILEAARNTDAHDLFLVIGLSGLRPSNVRLLTVAEVDVAERTLQIAADKMKNAKEAIVPVSGFVADLLAEHVDMLGDNPDTLLFPARGTGIKPKSIHNLSRSYRSVVRAKRLEGADVDWSSLYDLRHFFASQLAKQGANEQQIGRLLCHVGQSVTSRYVHQDIEDLRHFVDELAERYLEASGAPSLSHHAERQDQERITV